MNLSNGSPTLAPRCLHGGFRQNKTEAMLTASFVVGGLGVFGCIFNVLVFLRIVIQGYRLTHRHFSRMYFTSLAVADFLVAAFCVGYTFRFQGLVSITRNTWEWYTLTGVAWTTHVASLLHVVAITVDRVLAQRDIHYNRVMNLSHNRWKVKVAIVLIWVISGALVASMAMNHKIAFWMDAVGVPLASLGMIAAYGYIIGRLIKSEITAKYRYDDADGVAEVDVRDVMSKSVNTILLSSLITATFIISSLPITVVVIKYLDNKTCPSPATLITLQGMFVMNTILDPLLYALCDVVKDICIVRVRTVTESSVIQQELSTS